MTSVSDLYLVAIVPALNESDSILHVINTLLEFSDVVVIDDGSWDNTGELARGAGAHVITHQHNQGYDKALQSGILWAAQMGYQYAITFDADGQHHAQSIPLFVRELNTGADVVIGVRDSMQRWGEKLFAVISYHLWKISDPLSGMKGYRLQLVRLERAFDTYGSIGTEFCIRAARSGCLIRQVPIHTSKRADAPRFGSSIRANLMIIRSILFGLFCAQPFHRACKR